MPNSADRDQGLKRVSSITRWVATAAIVVSGLLSAAAAKAIPGKSKPTRPSVGLGGQSQAPGFDGSSGSAGGSGSADGSGGGGGLVPPAQLPGAGSGPGAVSSGAS